MERSQLKSAPTGEASGNLTLGDACRSFKKLQLRQLMNEREEVVSKLVELDYVIWVLEESFRSEGP